MDWSLTQPANGLPPGYCALSVNASVPDLETKDFRQYLRTLSPEVLEQLYDYPPICMAVYRELPDIARHYVMRVLFIDQPVPQAVMTSWATQKYAKDQADALAALEELNMWRVTAIPGGLSAWELCPTFKNSLKAALVGGGRLWIIQSPEDNDARPRDVDFLDQYALSRWRCVLHYMVGAGSTMKGIEGEVISPDAVRILLHAKLMKRDDKDGVSITRQGFQFLLLDAQSQVWHFMLHYLTTCEERGLSLPECLSMLFELSFSTLGNDYCSEELTPKQLTFLQHLREFGLVFQRKRKEGRFYPTRLILNITDKAAAKQAIATDGEESTDDPGYIIVETNYRIYAYTDSPLQIAILALFTELVCRFPNMTVGVLTRDSVRQALRGGITASQILRYLELHAHSQMRQSEHAVNSASPLPPTITDQVRLWEMERNRFTYVEGVVYNQFLSQADFVTLRDYAQSINMLEWQNERTRTMVVSKNGHDDVKKFWKRYSKGGG